MKMKRDEAEKLIGGYATGTLTAGDPANLVVGPITTACFSCHDSNIARQHMENEGGSIYRARSTALATGEACMFCHNPSSPYGLGIKAVHEK